jgi:A/G-specific adenine glycosylase
MGAIAPALLVWQKKFGRHGLAWQNTRDPYRVWLSEIMLQQTQVGAVMGYYERFLNALPTVQDLAQANPDAVMALWAGLGYYSRARNLHACAKTIMAQWQGEFPRRAQQLAELPGIGRSTAAAIAAFCFGEPAPILDGNVKRVFARVFLVPGWPGNAGVQAQLWRHAEQQMAGLVNHVKPEHLHQSLITYTQGLMDLGATVCTRSKPRCGQCPLQNQCAAFAQGKQAEVPASKPKKPLPTRFVVHWLITNKPDKPQRWLLQRQPSPGIWAGLWCGVQQPYEASAHPLPNEVLTQLAGQRGLVVQAVLPQVKHDFTHYRLMLLPVIASPAQSQMLHEPEPDAHWVEQAQLAALGLPAPIKKLFVQQGWLSS